MIKIDKEVSAVCSETTTGQNHQTTTMEIDNSLPIGDLKLSLTSLCDPTAVNVKVFVILEKRDELVLRLADIENSSQGRLRDQLITFIKEKITDEDDISLLNLSSYDDRKTVLYKYDIEGIPEKLQAVNSLLETKNEAAKFNFSSDNLSEIKAFLFVLGNAEKSIHIFRKNFPINLFSRDKLFLRRDDKERFVSMDEDFLKVDCKLDFFYLDDAMFIYNLSILEKFFGLDTVIKQKAQEGLANIEKVELVSNLEVLNERADELSFARKLTKVAANSPVLKLPVENVIEFTKKYPTLINVFKYNADGTKLMLDTKKSQNMFLKLLGDDFLHSELTNTRYTSIAKDKVTTESVTETSDSKTNAEELIEVESSQD